MQHATLPALSPASLTPAEFAAVSYLARYTGKTHDLYRRYLGVWFAWCARQQLDPLAVKRAHVELFVRHRIELGNAPSSVRTIMAPVKGYYRFATYDGVIDRNPAEYVRLPKINRDPSARTWLTRLEISKFLHASATITPMHHALAYLLAINGLRISEACGIQIEDYLEQESGGHRVLRIVGKGSKPATTPITVPVWRALEEARDGRQSGPLLLRRKDGAQLDPRNAAAMVETICRHAGITKHISPHAIRRSAITAGLDAGISIRTMQGFARHADPRTTSDYDMGRQNLDTHAVHTLTAYLT